MDAELVKLAFALGYKRASSGIVGSVLDLYRNATSRSNDQYAQFGIDAKSNVPGPENLKMFPMPAEASKPKPVAPRTGWFNPFLRMKNRQKLTWTGLG